MLLDNGKPRNYEEAMTSLNFDKWFEAMKSEIGSMYEKKYGLWWTCPMIGRPLRINGSFKRKTDTDSNITIYKAQLVANGF